MDEIKYTCSRCKRERLEKYVVQKTNRRGKKVWRCRARSVCASKSRRLRITEKNEIK